MGSVPPCKERGREASKGCPARVRVVRVVKGGRIGVREGATEERAAPLTKLNLTYDDSVGSAATSGLYSQVRARQTGEGGGLSAKSGGGWDGRSGGG